MARVFLVDQAFEVLVVQGDRLWFLPRIDRAA
jgi:hypothetical protein